MAKQDRELWTTLAVIVLLNAAFIGALAQGWLPGGLYDRGRFLLLAACLVGSVFWHRGFPALHELAKPLTVWRVHPAWFLFALAAPMGLCLMTLLAKAAWTGRDLGLLLHGSQVQLTPQLALTILLAALVGELVWVSYAVGRLRHALGVLPASLVVGAFWTAWWTPMVLLGYGVIPNLPLLGMLVNMLGVAALCGWVYTRSGSGLVVLVMQVTLNSALLVFPVTPNHGLLTYYGFSAIYLVVSLCLYALAPPSLPRQPAPTRPIVLQHA